MDAKRISHKNITIVIMIFLLKLQVNNIPNDSDTLEICCNHNIILSFQKVLPPEQLDSIQGVQCRQVLLVNSPDF